MPNPVAVAYTPGTAAATWTERSAYIRSITKRNPLCARRTPPLQTAPLKQLQPPTRASHHWPPDREGKQPTATIATRCPDTRDRARLSAAAPAATASAPPPSSPVPYSHRPDSRRRRAYEKPTDQRRRATAGQPEADNRSKSRLSFNHNFEQRDFAPSIARAHSACQARFSTTKKRSDALMRRSSIQKYSGL